MMHQSLSQVAYALLNGRDGGVEVGESMIGREPG